MGWLESERERLQGQWHGHHHGNNGPRSGSEVGLSRIRCSTEALVAGAQFWATRHQIPLCTIMVSSCTRPFLSERLVGAWQTNFLRSRSVKPDVQAEVALYQSTRAPNGTFVEYTSRISNKIREMDGGFTECLPPKMKSFVIRRQGMLTPDQAKHLHFFHTDKGDSKRTRWLMH